MAPVSPPTSLRLVRAAAAERAQLDRHRERLLQTHEQLREELERVERSLLEVDERCRLLDRLASPPIQPTAPSAADVHAGALNAATCSPAETKRPDADLVDAGAGALRGPAIRTEAVRLLLADPATPEALHYRDWFQRLLSAGFVVAGKDPQAVFLTQLTRSPVVRKSTQAGIYELDRHAPRRLRHELDDLQRQLRELTAPTAANANLAAVRARRAALSRKISHAEKALEEALDLLGQPLGPTTVIRAAG